jgi:tetratricopeptide (TPR) repeat protein
MFDLTGGTALMIGQHINQYRVVRKLGEGGMGAVYEAINDSLQRRAAIKVLLPEIAHNPEVAARFFNEARAVNIINHPSIVEIYEFGHLPDKTAFIVMEYLEGEALTERMRKAGRVSSAEALRLTRQIASALAAAHAKGIVHRDLKPDNVYIVADPEAPAGERVKVLDFGIAKVADELQGNNQLRTRASMVMGTPAYMAPEQCLGAAQVDDKADVYALGVILFQMASGQLPFNAPSSVQLMHQHIQEPPPALTALDPQAPPEIAALLARMLAKAPAERPSMGELVAALEQLGAVRTGRDLPPATRAPSGGAGKWIALGLAVTAVLGVGGFILYRHRTAAPPTPPPVVVDTVKPPTTPLPDERAYKGAIGQGRKLMSQGQFAAAVESFKRALVARPNDPRAFMELGIAHFKLHDLDAALDATQKSMQASSEPALRGAALYNIGRIREEGKDRAAAVDAYKQSLAARPNRIVRERLATLDPAAAAALDPLAAHAMSGPFDDLAEYCKRRQSALRAELPAGAERDVRFSCDDPADLAAGTIGHGALALASPTVPYRAARVLSLTQRWPNGAYDGRLALAVQTDVGWFVDELARVQAQHGETNTLDVVSIEQQDVIPEGAPELVVRYTAHYRNPRNHSDERSRWLLLAGIGPSGAPGATHAVQVELTEESEPEEGVEVKTQVDAFEEKFLPTGEIELVRSPKSTRKVSPQGDLAGVHKLSFP